MSRQMQKSKLEEVSVSLSIQIPRMVWGLCASCEVLRNCHNVRDHESNISNGLYQWWAFIVSQRLVPAARLRFDKCLSSCPVSGFRCPVSASHLATTLSLTTWPLATSLLLEKCRQFYLSQIREVICLVLCPSVCLFEPPWLKCVNVTVRQQMILWQ